MKSHDQKIYPTSFHVCQKNLGIVIGPYTGVTGSMGMLSLSAYPSARVYTYKLLLLPYLSTTLFYSTTKPTKPTLHTQPTKMSRVKKASKLTAKTPKSKAKIPKPIFKFPKPYVKPPKPKSYRTGLLSKKINKRSQEAKKYALNDYTMLVDNADII